MRVGDLNLEKRVQGPCHQLLLAGELDLVAAPALEDAVASLCTDGASEVELDLGQLTFIDSTGLHAILTSMELCEERLCDFWLIPGTDAIQRVFELTGFIDRLPFRKPTSQA
jgi:anti-sigma B factor antagonist